MRPRRRSLSEYRWTLRDDRDGCCRPLQTGERAHSKTADACALWLDGRIGVCLWDCALTAAVQIAVEVERLERRDREREHESARLRGGRGFERLCVCRRGATRLSGEFTRRVHEINN